MTTRFRPLCLDPFEDRAVPSHGQFAFMPPGLAVAAAHRIDLSAPADDRDEPGKDGPGHGQGRGPDERGPQLTGPGRSESEFAASRFLVAVVVPPRVEGPAPVARPASVTPAPTPPPVADRAGGTIPARLTARAYETEAEADTPPRAEPPVVVLGRPAGLPPVVAIHEAIRAAILGAAWPLTSTSAQPVATPGNTNPPPAGTVVPFVAADQSGPGATQGQPAPAGVAAAPVAADPAAGLPDAVVSTPAVAVQAPTAETAPLPSLVGRVIEAVFPAGGPLGGALPVDLIAVDADAAGLLAGLADLGDSVADGWAGPERWAWLTAAALTAGGVGYVAVGDARGRRRAGPAAAATDSALARWEERNGDRTG